MNDNEKRLPRYKRTTRLPFRLEERDIEILKLVYDYRFLTSKQIQYLVDGSNQVILRRLQKLFHNGYLDRINGPLYKHFIYGLGNKGADELNLLFGIDRTKTNLSDKNKEATERYLQHTLMISNFRAILTLSLKNNPDTFLKDWLSEGDLKKEKIILKDNPQLIPDGFIVLSDHGDNLYFYLEADRSTTIDKKFFEKTKIYWDYFLSGKWHEKINEKVGFRVLTICKSEARAENLRNTVKELDNKAQQMFWFTSEKNFGLENPKTILEPIWKNPRDDAPHHILE